MTRGKPAEIASPLTINAFVDVAARHAESFAWSNDSGAQ